MSFGYPSRAVRGFALFFLLALAWWPPTARAQTVGGACSLANESTPFASATSLDYVTCVSSIWTLQPIQPGAATAACAAGTAGQIQWASNVLKYCDGSVWQTLLTSNSGTALNAVSAATGNQAGIANAAYTIQWNWDALAGGSALTLSSVSTAAASNAQKMLNISLSGTNGTSAQTTYGAYISNTHAGTTSTNVGLYATASGGTTANYAAIFGAGSVGIGTATPQSLLHVQAGEVQVGSSGAACAAAVAGAVRYSGGNLYYCNGSGWQPISNNGPGVLISTVTASASASIQFTALPTTYNTLFLNCSVVASTVNAQLFYRVGEGAGPTWETGAHYTVTSIYAGPATAPAANENVTNATDLTSAGSNSSTTVPDVIQMHISNVGSSSLYKVATFQQSTYQGANGVGLWYVSGTGYWNNDTNAITGLELVTSTGTVTGTCSLYGMN